MKPLLYDLKTIEINIKTTAASKTKLKAAHHLLNQSWQLTLAGYKQPEGYKHSHLTDFFNFKG